jgi:hypothetical protein
MRLREGSNRLVGLLFLSASIAVAVSAAGC